MSAKPPGILMFRLRGGRMTNGANTIHTETNPASEGAGIMIGQLCRPLGSNIDCEAVAGVNLRMRRRSPRTLDCPCGFVEKHKRKGRSYFPQPRMDNHPLRLGYLSDRQGLAAVLSVTCSSAPTLWCARQAGRACATSRPAGLSYCFFSPGFFSSGFFSSFFGGGGFCAGGEVWRAGG